MRFWNKNRKWMVVDATFITISDNGMIQDGNSVTHAGNLWVPMYSTGCRDKDDQVIFEGDLLRLFLGLDTFGSGLFEIIFNRGAFCLKTHFADGFVEDQFSSGLVLSNKKDADGDYIWEKSKHSVIRPIYDFGSSVMKVVGNVYEHPDFKKQYEQRTSFHCNR